MLKRRWSCALAVAAVPLVATAVPARDLSFEDRVRAQEAIERVYYSHQIDAKKTFEEAVPRAVLEGKVRKYLKQSAALEAYWGTPVTAEMLRKETARQAEGTRMPERLRELYRALGDAQWLVQECLARPALADRLARNFFSSDPAIHARQRQAAEAIRAALASGAIDPYAERSDRTVVTYVRAKTEADPFVPDATLLDETDSGEIRTALDAEDFDRMLARFTGQVGTIGPLVEEREAFVTRVFLRETADEIAVASFEIPKTTWDAWWSSVERSLDAGSVPAVADANGTLPVIAGEPQNREDAGYGLRFEHDGEPGWAREKPCEPVDEWEETSLGGLPEARAGHTAVWTGTEMIVWGGASALEPSLSTGGRYDPATDTWRPTSRLGALAARTGHVAVWTGSEMIVWGGGTSFGEQIEYPTGGRYDPAADSWAPMAAPPPPFLLTNATSVWTGRQMIVWGRDALSYDNESKGGRYDPEADAWTPVSPTGAPSGRKDYSMVWAGQEMIVWGGYEYGDLGGRVVADGGRYDPETDAWSPIAVDGAPAARCRHTAVWTGSTMMVWGGHPWFSAPMLDSGGLYDPLTDRWVPTMTENAPLGRYGHTAVWTGGRVVVWGGSSDQASPATQASGGRYDPKKDAWEPTSAAGAPAARYDHTAVWTGSRMIVWGGRSGWPFNTGGRYDPKRDSWTPTSPGAVPDGLAGRRAVWTGTEMIVWGGPRTRDVTGGRYDPALDAWTATSVVGAPHGRKYHIAVWTGEAMVVWGGSETFPYSTYGGRYYPVTDSWASVSTANAPSPRMLHTAIWTGSEVVIWGGYAWQGLNTGGRYDPVADSWRPTSLVGAPAGRTNHTAVWTGTHMVVWGGHSYAGASGMYLFSGGRYDPLEDVWLPTATFRVPGARVWHTAVWTGREMIVWGGYDYYGYVQAGGRYDPVADCWTPVSTAGAPLMRSAHTAVWTGEEMIVWGGVFSTWEGRQVLDTGGRYDPVADAWSATSTVNAPKPRIEHSALWTGDSMLVWGGSNRPGSLSENYGFNDGGSYRVCAPTTGEWGK